MASEDRAATSAAAIDNAKPNKIGQ